VSTLSTIGELRQTLQRWLDVSDPEQAVFAYYMLYHPASRTRLYVTYDQSGEVAGALAECLTGYDLFRPLYVMLAENEPALRQLIQEIAPQRRPGYLLGPMHYLQVWRDYFLLSGEEIFRLYVLDVANFQPIINILVTRAQSPDGQPRYEIRSPKDEVLAFASVNWRSPQFAEVAVHEEPAAQGRHWGESVVSALCAELVREGVTPLYLAGAVNPASIALAERVGFRDTGRRLAFASAEWRPTA
jgi:hypothetical protein